MKDTADDFQLDPTLECGRALRRQVKAFLNPLRLKHSPVALIPSLSTMKFSKCVLLAAIAPATIQAFAPMRPIQRPSTSALNALEDLEAKLLSADEPKKKPEKKKADKAKPETPKKAEKPAAQKLGVDLKAELSSTSIPTPSPAPAPAPKKAPVAKKEKPTAPVKPPAPAPAPVKPAPVKAAPVKVEKPKPEKPKPKAPPAPPKAPAEPDALAVPKGLALGAAPLVVAPVVALAAGRDFLSKTAARREAIQKEIAAKEAAMAKKKASAEVDFGGVVGAAVRNI